MSLRYVVLLLVSPLLAQCHSTAVLPGQSPLRLNEIQFLGSHNSYKQPIDNVVMAQLARDNPPAALSLDYSHEPLARQLDLGLRKVELDIFYDPEGGRYARPMGAMAPGSAPYDQAGEMNTAGFKTLHVQDIDFRSHCLRFLDCLSQLKRWSGENPMHLPIFIMINAKDDVIDRPGFVRPLKFDARAWDALDEEIRAGLGDRLLTPDQVRGDAATLRDAVMAGWPPIDNVRGRFLVVLDDNLAKKRAYIDGHPSLRGRAMFVDAPETYPEASIRIVNDPVEQEAYIQGLVKQGFIVRTRADADTREARTGDYTRFDAAKRSGAQIISTDYYLDDDRFPAEFLVRLPGDVVARCNPVLKPDGCPFTGR